MKNTGPCFTKKEKVEAMEGVSRRRIMIRLLFANNHSAYKVENRESIGERILEFELGIYFRAQERQDGRLIQTVVSAAGNGEK